ncbi:unnamed protein product [Protopolystoma xenopodis]|uniref:Uncharacterized protein n=1 Tax=Protopolystoma xenopodis TaxID=117903 RepID=A0A448X1M4_9PLAT|nr:unnamed protein product [Protopolystoma xenopodis]
MFFLLGRLAEHVVRGKTSSSSEDERGKASAGRKLKKRPQRRGRREHRQVVGQGESVSGLL